MKHVTLSQTLGYRVNARGTALAEVDVSPGKYIEWGSMGELRLVAPRWPLAEYNAIRPAMDFFFVNRQFVQYDSELLTDSHLIHPYIEARLFDCPLLRLQEKRLVPFGTAHEKIGNKARSRGPTGSFLLVDSSGRDRYSQELAFISDDCARYDPMQWTETKSGGEISDRIRYLNLQRYLEVNPNGYIDWINDVIEALELSIEAARSQGLGALDATVQPGLWIDYPQTVVARLVSDFLAEHLSAPGLSPQSWTAQPRDHWSLDTAYSFIQTNTNATFHPLVSALVGGVRLYFVLREVQELWKPYEQYAPGKFNAVALFISALDSLNQALWKEVSEAAPLAIIGLPKMDGVLRVLTQRASTYLFAVGQLRFSERIGSTIVREQAVSQELIDSGAETAVHPPLPELNSELSSGDPAQILNTLTTQITGLASRGIVQSGINTIVTETFVLLFLRLEDRKISSAVKQLCNTQAKRKVLNTSLGFGLEFLERDLTRLKEAVDEHDPFPHNRSLNRAPIFFKALQDHCGYARALN